MLGYPISGYLMEFTYTAQVEDLPGHLGSLRAPLCMRRRDIVRDTVEPTERMDCLL